MMTHFILPRLISALSEEDGAVTVDWVVLTAAVVSLALVVSGTVGEGAMVQADALSAGIRDLASLLPWN